MTDDAPSSTADTPAVAADRLSIPDAAALADRIVSNVERVIVGQHDAIEHILVAMLARGHVLIEDVPGVGKTMLARAIARSFDGSFKRVQFTPDLLPSDVTGVNVFDQQTREFEFQPGPVFGNVVLGDEINRAPPKTQSALLEAMEETQVTVDGTTRPLPRPFTVIATQNAVEPSRTYDLPMAELDRFMKKLELGYPTPEDEREVLARVVGEHPIESLEPAASDGQLQRAQATAAAVTVDESVREYAVSLATYTREHAALGVSPRGTVALVRVAQARALLDGREYVIPDDIQTEAPVVMPHRINCDREDGDPDELVARALDEVAVP